MLRTNPKKTEKIVGKIKSYPVFTGIFIGLIFFGFIIISLNWFPWVLDAWTRNNAQVRSIYFTAVFFIVFIARLSRQRRRNAFVFWASMCVFFLFHVLFVVSYSNRVHPILLKEWIIILTVESFILVFSVDWLTRSFGQLKNHEGPRPGRTDGHR